MSSFKRKAEARQGKKRVRNRGCLTKQSFCQIGPLVGWSISRLWSQVTKKHEVASCICYLSCYHSKMPDEGHLRKGLFGLSLEGYSSFWRGRHGSGSMRQLVTAHLQLGGRDLCSACFPFSVHHHLSQLVKWCSSHLDWIFAYQLI